MFQNMNRRPRSLLLPFAAGHFANDLAPVSVLMLAPAIALAIGRAESAAPCEIGTISCFGELGCTPFKLACNGLTIRSGTAVFRQRPSRRPRDTNRWARARAVVATATIPNELVAERDAIIDAASPVATPHRDFTPCGPSLLTTSSR